jgi:hypothetical protein
LVQEQNHILFHRRPDGEIFILGREENTEIQGLFDSGKGDVILAVFPVWTSSVNYGTT